MPLYSLDNLTPRIDRSAYIHPDAVIIGAVDIGASASVWPSAVLRGDNGLITIGARTSIQDGTVIHTTERAPTVIGADCVVGHNAHLEGCIIEDGCLVGSMSTVLHGACARRGSMIAAGALVPPGLVVPEHARAIGVPARIVIDAVPVDAFATTAAKYVENGGRYARHLRVITLEECVC